MSVGAGDILSRKFNKLSGKKEVKEESSGKKKPAKLVEVNESSDLHNPAREHESRMKSKKHPSANGGAERPAVSRMFPSTSKAPQVPQNFDPVLAVYIAKLMPLYWDKRWTYEELMKLAKQDGAQIAKGTTELTVRARMTIVIDRLNIMQGKSQLDSSSTGYFELRFVKDMIRFRHFVATGWGVVRDAHGP